MPDAREPKAAALGENYSAYVKRHVLDVVWNTISHIAEPSMYEVLCDDLATNCFLLLVVGDPLSDDQASVHFGIHVTVVTDIRTGWSGDVVFYQYRDSDEDHPPRKLRFSSGFGGSPGFGLILQELNEMLMKRLGDE